MNKLTRAEIIQETLRTYETSPESRAVHEKGGCFYSLEREEGIFVWCAVGRCMLDATGVAGKFYGSVSALIVKLLLEEPDSVDHITKVIEHLKEAWETFPQKASKVTLKDFEYIDDLVIASTLDITHYLYFDKFLKPEYHGHPVRFWTELQELHDNSDCWGEDDRDRRRALVKKLLATWG